MTKSIYVGNLPFSITTEDVKEMFTPYGAVVSVNLIFDKNTGRPRGFGFVEMDAESIHQAVENLNGADVGGRKIVVNEAKEERKVNSGGGKRPRR